jgi:hypothetical protein
MILVPVILFLIAVAPVYGAPSLSLGSTVKYDLAASVSVTQSCTADPVTLAYQACTGIVPPPNPPIVGPPFLNDDLNYANISQMQNAGWGLDPSVPASYYSFSNSIVTFKNDGTLAPGASWIHIPSGLANWSVSTRVEWVGNYYGTLQLNLNTNGHYYTWEARGTYDNFGLGRYYAGQPCCDVVANASSYIPQLNTWHVLRADMLNNVISGYFDGNLILSYVEPDMTPGGTDLTSIGIQGSYFTYSAYDWITAAPLTPVPPTVLPPPSPTTFQVDLSGNVGWSVEGLSAGRANLEISHNLAVSVPLGALSLTPVTESGSFPQSIDLATRQESPGTASALLKAIFSAYLQTISGLAGPAGFSGPTLSTMLANTSGPDYTQWWVNGPLSDGSPVQILHGWSSVTGSESLNLGGSLGTRSAWVVTSQLSQTVTTNIPNLSNPLGSPDTSTVNFDLGLLWSFDKTADLLLRNNDTITLAMHSVTATNIFPTQPCIGSSCTLTNFVNVIRDAKVTANLTMVLSSTSLSLPRNGAGSNVPTFPLMGTLAALPWIPMGLAGFIAGAIAGAAVLLIRKMKGNVPPPVPAIAPGPTANST